MPFPANYASAFRTNARTNNRVIPVSCLIHYSWTATPAAVTNGISVAHVGAAAAGSRDMVLGGSLAAAGLATLGIADLTGSSQAAPAVPRNVVITVTHASAVVAMSGTIYGTDWAARPIQEDWAVTAGTVSKTFTGKKAFVTVNRITETIAADSSANTIIAGTGNALGILVRVTAPNAVQEVVDAAVVTTGVLAVASALATADAWGTYTPAAAPNAVHNYDIWFISDDPQNS